MKLPMSITLCLLAFHSALTAPFSTDGNRFTYLDSDDPFYVGLDFPKLVTPQWIGEEGVDAVVILSIDDMRETPKYEAMLRPILDRLKKIDGRAPASIMVNSIPLGADGSSPANPQLQSWLAEGVSLECHTLAHPCPLCQKGDFSAAAQTYHGCVDLLNSVPGNKPVAFRMPCCDSMNSPSPRFYSEIFNRNSTKGNNLTIDSSVMVILTTNDASLPRELVLDSDGRERFRKYLPAETNATTRVSMGSFTTTIEDYPYPYIIGKHCWEFPCIVPSDWEANNLHKPNNPKTVEDWKRALDAIVIKQGVMTFIFHPHGWIQATQMVEFVDYAATKYGKRIKFLNFKEAQERLDRNLLAGQSLRAPGSNVWLLDLNNDGFLDVTASGVCRVWNAKARQWKDSKLPFSSSITSALVGVLNARGSAVIASETEAWEYTNDQWEKIDAVSKLLDGDRNSPVALWHRLRDVDRDGVCELIGGPPGTGAVYKWATNGWRKADYSLPPGTTLFSSPIMDAGLRFVDVDGDGYDDVLFSNHERYSLHLFRKDSRNLRLKPGWTDEIISRVRNGSDRQAIPPIVRDGTNRNNGVWFKNKTMWIQNEDTAHLPDKVDRRTFKQLLSGFQPRALSPEESLRALRVQPGFKVDLVASEPLIHSPVAFEWSADGRLWVVEMNDYPKGVDGKGKGGGRVRVLEDADGDGRYENAVTFLEDLSFPNGIYPWRKGVVISAAPDIFYAEDTNGDGKADVREVLFTGFTPGNQQHRMNGFDFGLDGWLYGANGDSGGTVRPAGKTASSAPGIDIRNRDFRIHPDHRTIEAIEGQTQFGRHRDDFGNWFGNNNPTWLWHYFFPDHYLARNPFLPLKSTKKMLANYSDSTRCFPISRMQSRFNDPFAANHVTSGNSATPYRDNLFGEEFASSVFISEPVHNLVHREVLKPDGVTFTSRRTAGGATNEFLASGDNWFRPTMLKTGPDGALYVADMYRLVIEHPEWIPAEMQARLDLRAGADKGRIYRVLPEGTTLRRIPNLTKLSTVELANALDSPNGWQRDTVQRLLIERRDQAAIKQLEHHAKDARDAKVRLQALWTLNGLHALSPNILVAALRDKHAAVREHAVKLSETIQNTAPNDALLSLVDDSAPRVRYQLAFTLGQVDDARVAATLVKLARDEDANVGNAALSSATGHAKEMLALAEKLSPSDRTQTMLPMLRKLAANPSAQAKGASLVRRSESISAEHLTERAKVVVRYSGVSTLRGNAKNGAALFQQQCAQCHRLREQGTEVGPDLGMMAGKPVEQIVEAILNPNAAVEERYRSYSVSTTDSREVTGIIVSETPTTITLRAANLPEQTFLRGELREFTASGLSLMPDGLEAALTPQQLADVIAFVLGR
jgi:putative membrane-bound dehydrogenase-like protein